MTPRILALAALLTTGLATQAWAIPIQWTVGSGGNGHWYEVVGTPTTTSWSQANSLANASEYDGMMGHLATITSAEENDFVLDLVSDETNRLGPWLGGYQLSSDPESTWRWVTGEEFSFVDFYEGEPNDPNGYEDFLQIHPFFENGDGSWNDCRHGCTYINYAYMVEYQPAHMPEPSAAILFGVGVLIAVRHTRRRGA